MIKSFYPLLSENNRKAIVKDLGEVIPTSPFLKQPSYSLTNLGKVGWVSDEKGERFQDVHPVTNQPWGKIPDSILKVVRILKSLEHIPQDFNPDSCLINKFESGDKLDPCLLDKSDKNLEDPSILIVLGGQASHLMQGFLPSSNAEDDPLGQLTLGTGDVLVFSGMPRFKQFGVEGITGDKKQINLWLRKLC